MGPGPTFLTLILRPPLSLAGAGINNINPHSFSHRGGRASSQPNSETGDGEAGALPCPTVKRVVRRRGSSFLPNSETGIREGGSFLAQQ